MSSKPLDQLTDDEHAQRLAVEQHLKGLQAPAREKPLEQWSVEDHLEHQRTGRQPDSHEYRQYRTDVLAAAGLADELDDHPPDDLEQWSVEDHLKRQQQRRRA